MSEVMDEINLLGLRSLCERYEINVDELANITQMSLVELGNEYRKNPMLIRYVLLGMAHERIKNAG